MKIVTGILLHTFVVFFHLKCTESSGNEVIPNFQIPNSFTHYAPFPNGADITLEIDATTIYHGKISEIESLQFPMWIKPNKKHSKPKVYINLNNEVEYKEVNLSKSLDRSHAFFHGMRAVIPMSDTEIMVAPLVPFGQDRVLQNQIRIYVGIPVYGTLAGHFHREAYHVGQSSGSGVAPHVQVPNEVTPQRFVHDGTEIWLEMDNNSFYRGTIFAYHYKRVPLWITSPGPHSNFKLYLLRNRQDEYAIKNFKLLSRRPLNLHGRRAVIPWTQTHSLVAHLVPINQERAQENQFRIYVGIPHYETLIGHFELEEKQ